MCRPELHALAVSQRLRASCVKRARSLTESVRRRRIFSRVFQWEIERRGGIPRAPVRQTRTRAVRYGGRSLTSEWPSYVRSRRRRRVGFPKTVPNATSAGTSQYALAVETEARPGPLPKTE